MTTPDPFQTPAVRDDPAYWDELADRVFTSATRVAKQTTVDWLSESPARLVVAAVLLAAALTFTLQTSSSASRPAAWTQALAPSDTVGQTIILSDGPPAIGTLLLSEQGERKK
jgi:hypothetical protein